nr:MULTISPECIES: hydantoinase B/oxoprolinase family protein [Ramlibacter]
MPDDIRVQVLWGRLISVVEEQARTLMRTAFSPTVREAGDLSAGLFDLQGRLIAQAVTGTPGHVNSMAACAVHFLAKYPAAAMREGDHFITNDPWLTSGHLHDVTVLSPVFQAGEVIGFFACTCHQVDVGGLGQGPDGRSVHEEGLYIPILPLARAGQVNGDLLSIVRANVRQPDLVVGDILSYITANEVSGRRLAAMLDEFGERGLASIAQAVMARSAAGMRRAIDALPPGTYRSSLQLDGYDAPVHIQCSVTIGDGRIRVGFDGSSPASSHGINLVLNYTRAYAAFGVRAAVAPDVPNNAGSLALVEVDAPAGSILNAQHPAPVCARHIIGQFLPEVVLAALAGAMPGRIPAEGAACNWGLQLRGGPAVARAAGSEGCKVPPFEILFFNAGGSGARPASDGLSATAFPSGIRAIPVEVCESAAPIVIWRKELLPGSGGAGRFRGGLGQRVEVATLDGSPFQVFGIFDRVRNPARGRDGGDDGAPGWVGLASGQALRSMGLQTVPAGEVLRIDVPGGAGLGPAAQRDPRAVAEDERLGYLAAATMRP